MIRMGRSKNEPATETPKFQENYGGTAANGYQNRQENVQPTQARSAMSESESMARDIKEGRLSGFVGSGTVLTGETTFHAMLRVDGHLTGRVTSEAGTLIIGSTGRVDANILVAAAQINGTVNGDIIALEKIELGRSARVMGNIQTPRLVIEDGAVFEGSSQMLKARESLEQRVAEAKMQSQQAAQQTAVEPEEAANYAPEESSEAAAG